MSPESNVRTVSLIVPAYNESGNIDIFCQAVTAIMDSLPDYGFEVLFVNDGSQDATEQEVLHNIARDERFKLLSLSRNFGKEIALTAGLDHCIGDAAIPIDSDMQHPVELIAEFIKLWEQGYEMVSAVREDRDDEGIFKRGFTRVFYALITKLDKRVVIRPDAGDFRLMSRPVIDALCQMRERHRFMKGLYGVAGFRETSIPYQPAERHSGSTKWSFSNLFGLALEGVTSFTTVPLRFATATGFLCSFIAIVYGVWILFKTLIFGEAVAGFPTLVLIMLFIGGIQLFSLGIIGEYLGRIFNETKQRPLYFVKDRVGLTDIEHSSSR